MNSRLPPPPPRPRRSVGRWNPLIWVGLGIASFGVIAAAVWFVLALGDVNDDIDAMHRASTAADAEFVVDERVRWELFLEPSSATQSGLRYAVLDDAGEPVTIGRGGGTSYDWSGPSGRSIATVDLAPGRYRLVVEGSPYTLAIGDGPSDAIGRMFLGAALIGIPLVTLGLALAITAAIRDTRRRTVDATPPPPSPWSAGEWPADPGR